MNMLKKIFSLLLIFTVTTAIAQREPDAVYHKIIKEYTVHEDGSYDLHNFKQLELKSHYSFNQLYGETFIIYNPEYQELKINKSYTIMKDGKKVKTPENAFNEVLPHSVSTFPAYNQLREMVVTHTGLALGATIYLDYTLSTHAGMYGGLSVMENIKKQSPVKRMEIIVHAPENMPIFHKTRNLRTAPEITEKEGVKTYKWLFRDINPHPREGNICESSLPALFLQSGTEDVSTGINVSKISLQLPKSLKTKTAELTENKSAGMDKVNALRHYVVNEIDYSGLQQKHVGDAIRPFSEIYKTNIATYPEKLFLLAGMIRQAGISAYPVLIFHGGKLPVLDHNHQIKLKVDFRDDAPYICDLQEPQNLWYSLKGKEAYPLDKGKTEQKITFDESMNRCDFDGVMTVRGTKASAKAKLELVHHFSPYAAFGTDFQKYSSVVKGIQMDTAVVDNATLNATKMSLRTHSSKDILKKANNYRLLEIPEIKGSVAGWDLDPLYNERTTSFKIPAVVDENYRLELNIKDGKCFNRAIKKEMDAAFGSVAVQLKNKGDKVIISKKITLKKSCFNPIEYQQLRKMLRMLRMEELRKIAIR